MNSSIVPKKEVKDGMDEIIKSSSEWMIEQWQMRWEEAVFFWNLEALVYFT